MSKSFLIALKIQKYLSLIFLCLILTVSFETNVPSQTAQTCQNGPTSRLSFTVIDQKGEAPTNVTKEDLALKVDGNLTPVLSLNHQTELPLDLAILIDTSLSQERAIRMTKPFAKALLQEVLRSSNNRVALISFANAIEVEKDLTSDVSRVVSALETVQVSFPPGYIGGGVVISPGPPPRSKNQPGATSLWDTSSAMVEMIFGAEPDQPRSRAMLLLTDGDDTASQSKLNSAIKSALDHEVVVYAVGVAEYPFAVKRDSLKKISDETGGTAAFPKNRDDLTAALIEIQKRLASRYVVSFCSATQKTDMKVRLELNNQKFPKARIGYARERKQ